MRTPKSAAYELWPNRLEEIFVEKLRCFIYAQTNKSLIHFTMIRNVRKACEIIMIYNDVIQYYTHKTKHTDAWLKSLHTYTIIMTVRMIAQRNNLAIMLQLYAFQTHIVTWQQITARAHTVFHKVSLAFRKQCFYQITVKTAHFRRQ